MTPEQERQHLARQLRDIGQEAMQEWMRIVDLEDVAGIPFQARINWQDDEGLCMVGIALGQYGDEYGTFRLTVQIEDLGPRQPHGPETDPAMVHEMPGHGDETDAAAETITPKVMTGLAFGVYAHGQWLRSIAGCPWPDDGDCIGHKVGLGGQLIEPTPEPEVWVRTEMRHARVGDVIRPASGVIPHPGGQGTRVIDRYLPARKDASKAAGAAQPHAGHWHVVSGGAKHWDDRIVQEGEVWLVLEGNDQPQNLRPDFAIEIRMSPLEVRIMERFGWENRMDAR